MADVKDAVCGVEFEEESALDMGAVVVEHAGRRHYFCCETCASEFRSEPSRYQ